MNYGKYILIYFILFRFGVIELAVGVRVRPAPATEIENLRVCAAR